LAPAINEARVVRATVAVIAQDQVPANALSLITGFVLRAGIIVVAGGRIEHRLTTGIHVTTIVRTSIAVIADLGRTALTQRAFTNVAIGTGVAIVALVTVGHMNTALRGVTTIIGANVSVLTVQFSTPQALAQLTGIGGRAHIPVIARNRIQREDTATIGVAGVTGTNVAIRALQGTRCNTLAARTLFGNRTGITVVTFSLVVSMDTYSVVATGVVGANISIIAVLRQPARADTSRALLSDRTRVPVTAWVVVEFVYTTRTWVAVVICARIAIIAIGASGDNAGTTIAMISHRTSVSIITRLFVRQELAPHPLHATVVGARIAIIAGSGRTARAYTTITKVPHRTVEPITTRDHVAFVTATGLLVATVIGADIPVIAIGCNSIAADPVSALLPNGTGITVVTERTFAGKGLAAFAI